MTKYVLQQISDKFQKNTVTEKCGCVRIYLVDFETGQRNGEEVRFPCDDHLTLVIDYEEGAP